MEIGLGLDASLGLDFDDQRQLSREAAELGYESLWTPEGAGLDAFQLCSLRWQASAEVTPGGLGTGIAVAPVAYRNPVGFAVSAGTVSALTGGRFILGIGSGGIYRPETRRNLGIRTSSTLAVMRDYLAALQALLGGDIVNIEGEALTLRQVQLGISPAPETPVYLGALGPEMLRLGGELANGIALNWCTPEQIAWSRERVAEGAARIGRDPAAVRFSEYIRICVDDDEILARRSFGRAALGYALGQTVPTERERRFGYRAHFERAGFSEELLALDHMRNEGAGYDELVDACPDDLLRSVGYYGPAEGARDAFLALAEGLDTAIVRVVAARPTLDAVRAVMTACAPAA